jgi:hypothetical protein
LRSQAPDYAPPKLKMKATVHGHCHQKALETLNDKEFGKLRAEKEIFENIGLESKYPEDGCCGMAGAFGYEKQNGHYQVGIAVGERILLPQVRKAADDELIIADGFSCQEQIGQQTNRAAMHTAQVLQLAIHKNHRTAFGHPESRMIIERKRNQRLAMTRTAAIIGIGVLATFVAVINANTGRNAGTEMRAGYRARFDDAGRK